MSSADALTQRLEDLEVRYAYLERLIVELDSVVRETADELAAVKVVVVELRKQAEVAAGETKHQSLQEEKPPHY